jgi:GNAT superfamily N-acetyltransferase
LDKIRLSVDHVFKPFDCDTPDLNDFLLSSAKEHQIKLLAVTYLLESDTHTIAFFSLLNDKIAISDLDSKRHWYRTFMDHMPAGKKYKSYPAMKIGRLGVHKDFQGQGIGKRILDYLKIWFITNTKTGCKFITVDALKNSIPFYEKNGFDFLTKADTEKDSRQMYFDLTVLSNTEAKNT